METEYNEYGKLGNAQAWKIKKKNKINSQRNFTVPKHVSAVGISSAVLAVQRVTQN